MTPEEAHTAQSEDDRAETVPERLAGRYRVLGLLGKGGFGMVYEAHDELEDRVVALKLVRSELELEALPRPPDGTPSPRRRNVTRTWSGTTGGTPDQVAQAFRDEFRLLTQLHHPNLAAVYDFGRCPEHGILFFTQELVRGEELPEVLKGASRETIAEVFVQLARALDYIHTLGLVHGDIKPSNVLVCPPESPGAAPQAKLIDFGLARMLRPHAREVAETLGTLEDEITIVGTPGFSAPEKVRGEQTDGRSDIYSLAATLHTAIKGQRPFAGTTFAEVLRAQRLWRPELAGGLLYTAGPVVADLVGRMLEPDPTRRPQSARSIVLELLRREASHLRDRQQSEIDRREFARVLVEQLPFVDRGHALDLLLEKATALSEAASDPDRAVLIGPRQRTHGPQTVVVRAPEGMGKARLMTELRRELQLAERLFVEGSCWASPASVLGPFAAVVVQLAAAFGEGSPALRQYAGLVELAQKRSPDEAAAGQLTEFLIACARERPFVLHVSDLSKAGEDERTRIDRISRAIDHSRAAILFCITTEPHARIATVLQHLARDQVAEIWGLRPFSASELQQVLQGVLGDMAGIRELTRMLIELTGGHPLEFRETLRVLIEQGILVRDTDWWTLRGAAAATEELHKSLAQRSEARLDALGASGWEVASVLYLLEAPVEERQLAALSDLRPERFSRTLDRLEGEGLIQRSATSGSSMVQLAHQSVREAVRRRYEDSLDETRAELAARIEELADPDPRLVFMRARLLDGTSAGLEAVDALERAVDDLLAAKRPQLAAEVLERLIARLRKHGRTAHLDRLLRALLRLLHDAPGALEDPAREAAHYEAGILVAELLGDAHAQALFWLGLADRYTYTLVGGGIEATLARLDKADEAARGTSDAVLQLRIANRRAEVLLSAGEIENALRWSRQAMKIVDLEQASTVDKCHTIGVRLRCLSLAGHIAEARRLHELAKPIAAECPVVQRQSYLSGIAYLAVLTGDPERAIAETELALDELQQGNMQRLLPTPLHNLGDLRLRNDDLQAAERAFREAIRIASVYGYDYHVHLNRGFLGYVMARTGDAVGGAAMLAEARDGLTNSSDEYLAVQQLRLLDAEVAHMMGQSARARRELEEMLADYQTQNELSLAHWAREALARIERDLGTSFVDGSEADEGATDPEQDTVRTKPVR